MNECETYQARIEEFRKSQYLEFPRHVHMETLSKCNANCAFCPYPTVSRQGTKMSDALIEKVVGDLEDIPSDHGFQLSLFKVNEPFLDTRIFDVIDLCREKLPNATLALTTNATPLTEKKLAKLCDVSGLAYLWISVNECDADRYQETMGLPFAKTLERLDMIHQAVAENKFSVRVVLSRVGDGSNWDNVFRFWVKKSYPLFDVNIFQRGNWIGQVDVHSEPAPDIGCLRWFEVSITATGEVAHCCMDGHCEYPIGDIRKQHVLEVYNTSSYRALRADTRSRRDVEPCKGCSFT